MPGVRLVPLLVLLLADPARGQSPPEDQETPEAGAEPAEAPPQSAWVPVREGAQESEWLEKISEGLVEFGLRGGSAGRDLARRWESEVDTERIHLNQQYLNETFLMLEEQARILADQKRRAMELMALYGQIRQQDDRVRSSRAEIESLRTAIAQIERTRTEAEALFPRIYSSLRRSYLAGAVAWCPGRTDLGADKAGIVAVLREEASRHVIDVGRLRLIEQDESFRQSSGGLDPSFQRLTHANVERSMSVFPLADPEEYQGNLEGPQGRLLGTVLVIAPPLSAQPHLSRASEERAGLKPADGQGADARRALGTCKVHPFLIASPDRDGRSMKRHDPCEGAGEPGRTDALPSPICQHRQLREFLAQADQPGTKLNSILESVRKHQASSRPDEWRDAVRGFVRQIEQFHEMQVRREQQIQGLEASIRDLLAQRRDAAADFEQKCRARDDADRDGEERMSARLERLRNRRIVLMPELTRNDSDKNIDWSQPIGPVRELLNTAYQNAVSFHEDNVSRLIGDVQGGSDHDRQSSTSRQPEVLNRFRIVEYTRTEGAPTRVRRVLRIAFEFTLRVDPLRYLRRSGPVERGKEPGTFVDTTEHKIYYFLRGDEVGLRKARALAGDLSARGHAGSSSWGLVTADDLAAIRRICTEHIKDDVYFRGCEAAWTDTPYEDTSLVGDRSDYLALTPSGQDQGIPLSENSLAGVVLVARNPAAAGAPCGHLPPPPEPGAGDATAR